MCGAREKFKKNENFSCADEKGRLYISSLNGMDQLRAANKASGRPNKMLPSKWDIRG